MDSGSTCGRSREDRWRLRKDVTWFAAQSFHLPGLLGILLAALILPGNAHAQTTIFGDDFNRANRDALGNADVGGAWVETSAEGGNDADILNNLLQFTTNDVDNRPIVSNTFATAVSAGTITWTFTLDWARATGENFYSVFMQLGNGASFAAPPADGGDVAGVAINLRWGDDNFGFPSEEGFGYVHGTTQTQVATLSGLHTIEVVADLGTETFNLKIDGTTVASGVSFDKSLAGIGGSIDAIRLHQGEGISSGAGGNKRFDTILITHIGAASAVTSRITAAPTSVTADGVSTSTVTVLLKDASGNDLTAGGDAVTLATTLGMLGAVTDNGDGTYTATLTSGTTAGTAGITGTVNGTTIVDAATVTLAATTPSAAISTITASPTAITADGVGTSRITVRLKDVNGNDLTAGGDAVTLVTTLGTLGTVTDTGDGTYTATLASTVAGTAVITGTVNGTAITDDAAVTFIAGVPVALAFAVEPSNTLAGATIHPPVKVEAVDTNDNRVTSFSGSVTLAIEDNPGGGTLLGPTTAAAAGGVATFSDLSIDQDGTGYTLRATSGGLGSTVSEAFDILSTKVDLRVQMSVSEPRPAEGDTVIYTITVTNHGPRTATGVEITDELPNRVSYVSSSATKGSFNSTTGVWEVGTLAEGAGATLSITVTVNGLPSGST